MSQIRVYKFQAILAIVGLLGFVNGAVPKRDAEGLVPNKHQNFTYLGSVKVPLTKVVTGTLFGALQPKQKKSSSATSHYFLSQNSAGFATAEGDCKQFLGEDATLAYVETREELGNLTKFLESSDDTGSSYWVGAKYNTEKSNFVWLNGAEFGPWAPWAQGEPSTSTSLSRVSIRRVSNIKFRTQFQTVSNRYICEIRTGPVEEEAVPCYKNNDLVIVVDSSGSIGSAHYMVALEFTTRLATAWADNQNNRLSVIIYSSDARTVFSLNQHLNVNEIRDYVYKTPYLGGGTASDLGLREALAQFQQHRREVPKNLVFLTDGASNDRQATAAAADAIKAEGVRSFSVGIGSGIGVQELITIAGGDSTHVFNTDGFADLLKLLQPVSVNVCN